MSDCFVILLCTIKKSCSLQHTSWPHLSSMKHFILTRRKNWDIQSNVFTVNCLTALLYCYTLSINLVLFNIPHGHTCRLMKDFTLKSRKNWDIKSIGFTVNCLTALSYCFKLSMNLDFATYLMATLVS